MQLSHHARNHYANYIHVQSESNHEADRTLLPQTLAVSRNVAAGLVAGRWGRGCTAAVNPRPATAGQSYLRPSASLRSQRSPGRPATRAIKGNIRRYYKLLTRQTTSSPGSCAAPPVSCGLHEARSGQQDIQLNAYIRDTSLVKSTVIQSSLSYIFLLYYISSAVMHIQTPRNDSINIRPPLPPLPDKNLPHENKLITSLFSVTEGKTHLGTSF